MQQRLFDVDSIPNDPNYFTPQEKKKWSIEFRKYCEETYDKYGSLDGSFCCGCMEICNQCEQKHMEGCKDCVETIKSIICKIDYRDFDFKKWVNIAEELSLNARN